MTLHIIQQQRHQQDEKSTTSSLDTSTHSILSEAQTLDDEDAPLDAQPVFLHALCQEETQSGYYSDSTAQIYHMLAWHHYKQEDYSTALTFFLQSLRISNTMHGEDAPTTLLLLDDIQDLLDDMQLDNDYVDSVFDSWELQDETDDQVESYHATGIEQGGGVYSNNMAMEAAIMNGYQQALYCIPAELDLERANIYIKMAETAHRQHQSELALSFYCQALLILPQYLSNDHPTVIATRAESQQVAQTLTPVFSSFPKDNRHSMLRLPTLQHSSSNTQPQTHATPSEQRTSMRSSSPFHYVKRRQYRTSIVASE